VSGKQPLIDGGVVNDQDSFVHLWIHGKTSD